MSIGQSPPRLIGPVEDVAPDEEHGRLLVLGREIVIERIVGAVGSVVESVAHRPGFRYVTHVGGYSRELRGLTMSECEPCWKSVRGAFFLRSGAAMVRGDDAWMGDHAEASPPSPLPLLHDGLARFRRATHSNLSQPRYCR